MPEKKLRDMRKEKGLSDSPGSLRNSLLRLATGLFVAVGLVLFLARSIIKKEQLPEAEGENKETVMKELTLDATIPNIERVTEFVNEVLESADCPIKARLQIDMVIDEVFSNIAQYAYDEGRGQATVGVDITRDEPRAVVLRFADRGTPYDPLEKADPNVNLSAEEREIGGLGIFLVKKTMDDVQYEWKDGQNVLTLTKYI